MVEHIHKFTETISNQDSYYTELESKYQPGLQDIQLQLSALQQSRKAFNIQYTKACTAQVANLNQAESVSAVTQQFSSDISSYNACLAKYFNKIIEVDEAGIQNEKNFRQFLSDVTSKTLISIISYIRNMQYDINRVLSDFEKLDMNSSIKDMFKEEKSDKQLLCTINFSSYKHALDQAISSIKRKNERPSSQSPESTQNASEKEPPIHSKLKPQLQKHNSLSEQSLQIEMGKLGTEQQTNKSANNLYEMDQKQAKAVFDSNFSHKPVSSVKQLFEDFNFINFSDHTEQKSTGDSPTNFDLLDFIDQ